MIETPEQRALIEHWIKRFEQARTDIERRTIPPDKLTELELAAVKGQLAELNAQVAAYDATHNEGNAPRG